MHRDRCTPPGAVQRKTMTTKADFATGQYYHVYTRGVDRRKVFMDKSDFERFFISLFLFNDKTYKSIAGRGEDRLLRRCFVETTQYDPREKLVDIVTFNLLTNQMHMILVPLQDDGISRFMHRVLMGYAQYFNKKNDRVGALFETYKAKVVTSQSYLEHMVPYTHLNTIDMFGLPWRDGLVENWEQAKRHLEEHRWSGHHVAMRRPQKLPVVSEEYLHKMYPTSEGYLEHLKGWITRELIT